MKDLQTLVNQQVAVTRSGGDQFAQVRASDLTIEQKGAIKYFYERLHRIYRSEYRRQLPDESTERASKSEYGGLIMNLTKEQMDKGFDSLHEVIGKTDNDYRFMPLDMIIDLMKNGGNADGSRAGIYDTGPTEYQKQKRAMALESDEIKERRAKTAESSMSRLKGMFDDED